MKKGRGIIAILMMVILTTSMMPAEGKAEEKQLQLNTVNNSVPEFTAGNTHEVTLCLKNISKDEVKNLSIYPIIKDTANWPFVTDKQDFTQQVESIVSNQIVDVTFNLKARDDIESRRYSVPFGVSKDGVEVVQQTIYINGKAKEAPAKEEVKEEQKTEEVSQTAEEPSYGMESVSQGEYTSSGGGESSSIPRVIVTGFTTNPGSVNAGGDFVLTVNLKNTSASTKVSNLLFDFLAEGEASDEQTSGPAFIPTSGSSSVYLKEIGANGTASINISLNAKADLVNKPYGLNLSMKYEDGSANQIEASSGLSIPVKQKARFELSEFEISPEEIAVGEESNVMCNLYNMGRIKLYNVKAVFEGEVIEKEEVFVGNIEAGSTASIDAMLKGKKEGKGKADIKMTLTYEDESGNVETSDKTLKLSVTSEVAEQEMAMPVQEKGTGITKVIPIILIVIIVTAIVFFIIRRKKKKNMGDDEEELLDEINGSTKD